jgi:hypothetical protein
VVHQKLFKMTTQEAIGAIHAPKGMTSVISGIMSNDFSVLPHEKGKGSDLAKASEMVEKYEQDLKNCKSDWAYWSILGDLEYWRTIHKILEAGELVGHNNLPYVSAPDLENCVVMDSIGKVGQFGDEILRKAKEANVKKD